jgi:exopolysaccharide biosynthesis polyprenyl glycosylphosphotransferase
MASTTLPSGANDFEHDDEPAIAPVRVEPRRASLRRDLVLIDVVALVLAWAWLPLVVPAAQRPAAFVVAASMVVGSLLLMAWQRLYWARVCAVRSLEIVRLGRVTVVTTGAAILVGELGDWSSMTSLILVGHALLAFALLATGRALFTSWLRLSRTEGRHVKSVALIGWNDDARALADLLQDEPQTGYVIEGVVCDRDDYDPTCGLPWLAPVVDARHAVPDAGIGGVIIITTAITAADRNRLVRGYLEDGVHVQVSVGLERVDWRRLRALPLVHEPLFYVEPARTPGWRLSLKRAFDVVVGSVVFLLTLPFVAVAAFLILVTDGRPVLYRQTRVGRDGEPFTVLKLRTMCRDAEAQLAELQENNDRNGPLFKMAADPRVTRVGRWLRAASIDELPQLVNVLRGEMSLVGPRPALPEEVEQFDLELQARFRMRPGISGLWQVEARDNPSFRVYRHLDLFYLENWTLTLDLAILIATFELLVGRTIARAFNHLVHRHEPEPEPEPVAEIVLAPEPPSAAPAPVAATAPAIEGATPLVPVSSVTMQQIEP